MKEYTALYTELDRPDALAAAACIAAKRPVNEITDFLLEASSEELSEAMQLCEQIAEKSPNIYENNAALANLRRYLFAAIMREHPEMVDDMFSIVLTEYAKEINK